MSRFINILNLFYINESQLFFHTNYIEKASYPELYIPINRHHFDYHITATQIYVIITISIIKIKFGIKYLISFPYIIINHYLNIKLT